MRSLTLVATLVTLASTLVAQDRSADALGEQAQSLAAESFRHSGVEMSHSPSETFGRGVRMITLHLFADRLDPNDPRTHRVLADVYEVQGLAEKALRSAEIYFQANPTDHSAGLRWLFRHKAVLQSAEEALEFARTQAARGDLPDALRAEVLTFYADVLHSQGQPNQAVSALNEALRLDPYCPRAMGGVMTLARDPSLELAINSHTNILRGHPMSATTCWALGGLLGSVGLHDEAVAVFGYGRDISRRRTHTEVVGEYLLQYAGAMLDAGQNQQVVETFAPLAEEFEPSRMVKDYHESRDLRVLLIEAYRQLGKTEQADQLSQAVHEDFQALRADANDNAVLARNAGWFYLLQKRDIERAGEYSELAVRTEPDHPETRALQAGIELRTGQADAAVRHLKPVLGSTPWAGAMLLEASVEAGNMETARGILDSLARLPRRGRAFRHLARQAQRGGLTLPQHPTKQAARDAVAELIETYIPLWGEPEKILSVSVQPVRKSVKPCDPIELKVAVRNISKVSVPVGSWGLFSPAVGFRVRVGKGDDAPPETFTRVPLASLPSPRYLEPGAEISDTVRIDVADFARYIDTRPLEELTIEVDSLLDPITIQTDQEQDEPNTFSPLPGLEIAPATITRSSLFDSYPVRFDRSDPSAWQPAYMKLLGYMVREIKTGSLPERMRVARRLGSLLAAATLDRNDRGDIPEPLDGKLSLAHLVRMMVEMQKDRSPAVRAEMLAAMDHCIMEDWVLNYIAPRFSDPAAMVRYRALEVVAQAGVKNNTPVIQSFLTSDPDELIRRLADGLLRERPR
jgi:tetratricopeptide (TPR) repeat protein